MKQQDPIKVIEKAIERRQQITRTYRAIARGELWLTSDEDYEYLSLAADGAKRSVLAAFDALPESVKPQYARRADVAELLRDRVGAR